MRHARLYPLAALVLAACTHRVPVALNLASPDSAVSGAALATVRPPLSFRRGEFADKRSDTSRLATFKQQAHTYNLYGDRPMQEVLYDGLRAVLTSAGHRWASDSAPAIRLDVQLLNVQASRNAGMINVGASSSIQVKVDFVDAATGQPIYSEVYNGSDERARAMIGLMGMVRESLNASLAKCLTAVAQDPKLAAALQARTRA